MVLFDPITLDIIWNRLISIVEETSRAFVRISFSPGVRESNDFACVLLDASGNSIAQTDQPVPSFIGTIPITVKHFLSEFSTEGLKPGDVLITNDPWKASGHLPDITVATPIFKNNKLIAFAACTAHTTDIGGRVRSNENRDVFEEGLQIPPCKIWVEGRPNADVLRFIQTNVRIPSQVIGDITSQITANQMAAERLRQILEEYGIEDLEELSRIIIARSEESMRNGIRQIPNGTYADEMWVDGFEHPLRFRVKIDVLDDAIKVDFAGTSEQIDESLNVVYNYTYAMTMFALKSIICPTIPNNHGCFKPITVDAPKGSILNANYPASVVGRASIGHYVPFVIFAALSKVIPIKVQADSGAPFWALTLNGVDRDGKRFSGNFVVNGGQGASPLKDGYAALSFPSNISNTPIEIIEETFPVRIEKKEIIAGSGGAGRFMGGCGQEIIIKILGCRSMVLSLVSGRITFPARGMFGGESGSKGLMLYNGKVANPLRQLNLKEGDKIVLQLPGGGGFGTRLGD